MADKMHVSIEGLKVEAMKIGALEYQGWILRQIELVVLAHPYSMPAMLELSKRIAARAGIPFPDAPTPEPQP